MQVHPRARTDLFWVNIEGHFVIAAPPPPPGESEKSDLCLMLDYVRVVNFLLLLLLLLLFLLLDTVTSQVCRLCLTATVTVTVTEALVLRPLLEDRGQSFIVCQ